MKLKVSTSPYTYFLLLMTIMDTGYFVLLNIPGLRDSGYVRIGFLIIATLLAMNCYINKNIYRTLQPYYNYLNVFILYLVVFYFVPFYLRYGALYTKDHIHYQCVQLFRYVPADLSVSLCIPAKQRL